MDPNIHSNGKNAKNKSNNSNSSNSNFVIIDDEYQTATTTTNSNNNNNKKKWKCVQCTYENFPSSLKCTLCRSSRSNPNSMNNNKKRNLLHNNNKNLHNSIVDLSNSSTPLYEIELLDNRKLIKQKQQQQEIDLNNEINYKLNNLKLNSSDNSETSNDTESSPSPKRNISNTSNQSNSAISILNNNEETSDVVQIDTTKWSCTTCTYLNWPKSMKCVQCYTPKPDLSQENNTNENNSVSNGEINNKSNESNTILLKNQHNHHPNSPISNRSLCNSPCTVPKIELKQSTNNSDNNSLTPDISTTSNNNNNTTTDSSTSKKWPCSVCTYQNWPKSQRCVMCHLPRYSNNNNNHNNNNSNNLSPTPVSNNNSTTPIATNNNNNTNNNTTISSNNVNKKANTQQHKENIINIQINNSVNNNNSNNISNNTNILNQQQQKLLNYQLQMDRLFLSACQGVVEADLTNLNLYVTAGGDLTRCLTADECKILNKHNSNNSPNPNSDNNNTIQNNSNNNIYFPGLTLIHLCYQFKRKDILIKLLNQSNTLKKLYLNNTNNNNKTITLNNTLNNMKNNYYNNMVMNNYNLGNNNKITKILKHVNRSKFSPCQSCPSLASNIIDRYFSSNLRQRKTTIDYTLNNFGNSGNGGSAQQRHHQNSPTSSLITLNQLSCCGQSPSPSPPPYAGAASLNHHHYHYQHYFNTHQSLCFYVNELHTFTLPNEIDDFSPRIQNILFDELLDREVQNELEMESRIINWNMDLCNRLNSRLYPLWNRHSGDCLLDSVLQACYGVFDTDNTLRRIMAESLEQYSNCFKPRWKEHEILMAQSLDYKLDDYQLEHDWNNIITLANQPGASLEQAHIFALCHIFRRPIIVYSVRVIKSFRGENIGYTHFEGVYLPLIWEPSFCFKTPIALGYTRGHFTALVPLERTPEIVYPYYHSSYMSSSNNIASGCGAATSIATSSTNSATSTTPTNNNASNNLINHNNISNSSTNLANGGFSVVGATNNLSNSNNNLNGSNNNLSNIQKDNIDNKINNNSDNVNSTSTTANNDNSNSSNSTVGAVSYVDYNENQQQQIFYLPLTNNEGQLLPIHFLNSSELGREKSILRQYLNLDCLVMQGSNCALLVAQQRVVKQGMLVKQMLDEWLSYYRNMQAKDEYSHQIEISQDKENEISMENMCNLKNIRLINNNSKNNNNNNTTNSSSGNNNNNNNKNSGNNDEEEDEDDEDEDEDEDDEDEDDEEEEEEEEEEEYEDDEYCEEINVQ